MSNTDHTAFGPFYVSGVILAPGTSDQLGEFHCWGWIRHRNSGNLHDRLQSDRRVGPTDRIEQTHEKPLGFCAKGFLLLRDSSRPDDRA